MAHLSRTLDASVFIFDYRGYGHSEGTPNEAGCIADGVAAQRWLAERMGKLPSEVVVMGRSLGGAVAVAMAAEQGAQALVLEERLLADDRRRRLSLSVAAGATGRCGTATTPSRGFATTRAGVPKPRHGGRDRADPLRPRNCSTPSRRTKSSSSSSPVAITTIRCPRLTTANWSTFSTTSAAAEAPATDSRSISE